MFWVLVQIKGSCISFYRLSESDLAAFELNLEGRRWLNMNNDQFFEMKGMLQL